MMWPSFSKRTPAKPSKKTGVKPSRFNRITYGPLGAMASNGYTTATNLARTDGISSYSQSGDAHLRYDRPTLINQSRDFYRNNAIYRGIIDRAVAYVVGGGFGLLAKTSDDATNQKLQTLWNQFAQSPEIRNMWFGSNYEQMICREWFIAGDVLEVKLNTGKLQVFEAEQITDGTVFGDGIDKDQYGRPIRFTTGPYASYGMVSTDNLSRFDSEYCLFTCEPERPTASRGVPICQAAFSMLHRINDVCDSEALAWQMLSRLALSITRNGGPAMAYAESTADSSASSDATTMIDRVTDLGSAIIFHGEIGEEIKGVDRNIPGQNFSESLTMFLRLLGLPLGLPLEIVLLDWSRTSYSSSRAVLEQAYQTFTAKQNLLANCRYTPCYTWKVKEWVASGLIPDTPDVYNHEWITPSWPWIDQLKEVEANGMKLDRSFSTHAGVCKSLYLEREDVVSQREREIRDAIKRSKAIAVDTGVSVPWEIFAGLEPAQANRSTNSSETPVSSDKSDDDNDDKGESDEI